MDKEEIIKRLEKLSGHAVHVIGEPPLVMSIDDGIALIDAVFLLRKQEEQESVIEALKSDLDETLAVLIDRPEIIRCKDCKYWRQLYGDKPFYSSIGCCDCDDMWRSLDGETAEVNDIRTDSDFYCGYADRR